MKIHEIEQWMSAYMVKILNVTADQIDTTLTFDNYGINSLHAAEMIGDLSELLQRELPIEIVYDYPSIQALSRYLVATADDPIGNEG